MATRAEKACQMCVCVCGGGGEGAQSLSEEGE